MDSQRWARIQQLFDQLADETPEEQRAALARECPDDPAMQSCLLAMFSQDSQRKPLLGTDIENLATQLMIETKDPYLGRQFGPYLLKELVGEGGMGRVYAAERQDYFSKVAVKVLHDTLSADRRARFLAEQKILAKLNHPGIARLYDAGVEPDGTLYFAMEFVQGVSLIDYCRDESLSFVRKLQIFRNVCEAVQHAHQKSIVHRDLKPSNITVTEDGSVKLLDFGIAESGEAEPADRPCPDYMTLAYAAPEQIARQRTTVQADIYALGVVLQQIVTDRLPFDFSGKNTDDIRKTILNEAPRLPSESRPKSGVTFAGVNLTWINLTWINLTWINLDQSRWQDLDAVCRKALDKDPALRFSSVQEMSRDLDRLLGSEPLECRRPFPAGYSAARFLRRRAIAVLAGASAIAVLAAVVAWYTVGLNDAKNRAVAEARRAKEVNGFVLRLFRRFDLENAPGWEARIRPVLETGEREARAIQAQPLVQAEVFETLGSGFQNLGDLRKAASLLEEALHLRSEQTGSRKSLAIETQMKLAELYSGRDMAQKAEDLARRTLAEARAEQPPDELLVLKMQLGLGDILVEQNKYSEALKLYQDVFQQPANVHLSDDELVTGYIGVSLAYFYLGRHPEAREWKQQGHGADSKNQRAEPSRPGRNADDR